jgi:hypothetical protein
VATAHGYEARLEAACKRFSQCRYDGGAFGRIVNKREYVSSDLNHWSVKGHAKAAAVAWSAMKRAGLVPRSGQFNPPASSSCSSIRSGFASSGEELSDRYLLGDRYWRKVKNPNYWRRDSEIEAMQRSRERRRMRLTSRV